MARARTGTIETHGDHFDARVRLPDGRRAPRICLDSSLTREQARTEAAELQRITDKEHARASHAPAPAPAGPTLDLWSEGWFDEREKRGLSSVESDRPRWSKWISPKLGSQPAATVPKEEIERFVAGLDEGIRTDALGWKTALNVWTLVRCAFRDACSSKVLSLRARTDNPTLGVRGPDRGVRRSKTFLFPSEALRLLSCAEIPIHLRQAIALALYTGLRAAELRALRWAEIDLEHGTMNVHRSIDRRSKERSTKTKRARLLPIEPHLLPLLKGMHAAREGRDTVLRVKIDRDVASVLKRALLQAGIERTDLHVKGADRTRVSFRWHDLRGTFCTWAAVRGDDVLHVMARAGHEDITTTQGYVVTGALLKGSIGEVFPPLPLEALGVPPPAAPDASGSQGAPSTDDGRTSSTFDADMSETSPDEAPRGTPDEAPPSAPNEAPPSAPKAQPLVQNGANSAKSLWVGRDSNPGPTG